VLEIFASSCVYISLNLLLQVRSLPRKDLLGASHSVRQQLEPESCNPIPRNFTGRINTRYAIPLHQFVGLNRPIGVLGNYVQEQMLLDAGAAMRNRVPYIFFFRNSAQALHILGFRHTWTRDFGRMGSRGRTLRRSRTSVSRQAANPRGCLRTMSCSGLGLGRVGLSGTAGVW